MIKKNVKYKMECNPKFDLQDDVYQKITDSKFFTGIKQK